MEPSHSLFIPGLFPAQGQDGKSFRLQKCARDRNGILRAIKRHFQHGGEVVQATTPENQ
jgi:hypothetical protein